MKRIFFSVLVLSLFVIPCIASALDINDDTLLLYLPFNDDTEDYSKNGNHAEIVGNADFDEGVIGQALMFSEAGEVKAPYIPLNEKSFTVCMWVKPELAGGDQQCVFSQKDTNATNTSLHFRTYLDGRVRIGFYSNDLDAGAGTVKAGQWTHICFWLDVDDNSRRIYADGVQVAEDAGKSGIVYKGVKGETYVGSWSSSGQKFNGAIDEVQVWDRALDEDEILISMEDISSVAVNTSGKLASTWGKLKSK